MKIDNLSFNTCFASCKELSNFHPTCTKTTQNLTVAFF